MPKILRCSKCRRKGQTMMRKISPFFFVACTVLAALFLAPTSHAEERSRVTVLPVLAHGSADVALEARPLRSEWRRSADLGVELDLPNLNPVDDDSTWLEARTAAGSALSLDLPVGLWELKLDAAGFRPRCVAAVADRAWIQFGHRRLRPRSPRMFTITDPAGGEIAEAFVLELVERPNLLEWHECPALQRAREGGRVEIDRTFTGPWILGAPGFASRIVELLPTDGQLILEPLRKGTRTITADDLNGPIAGVIALLEGELPVAISDVSGRLSPPPWPGVLTLIAPDGRLVAVDDARSTGVTFPAPVEVAGRVVTYRREDVLGVANGVLWVPDRPGSWTVTDQEGHFRLTHASLDEREREPSIRLAASAHSYDPEVYSLHAGATDSESRRELLELELMIQPKDPAGVFAGRVLDADAEPLPRTPIHLIRSEAIDQRAQLLSGSGAPRGARSSLADDLGYFRIESIDSAPNDLLVLPDAAAPIVVTGLTPPPAGREESVGDLVAEPPWRFEGRVVDGERPLADVQIAVERRIQVGDWSRSFREQATGPITSGQDGRFSLPIRVAEGLSEGVDLVFSKPGFRQRTLRHVVAEPGSAVVIEMERLRPLAGIVSDARGRPLPRVRLHLLTEPGQKATHDGHGPGAAGALTTLSDEDGSFAFQDLPAAGAVLQTSREGFAARRLRIAPSSPPIIEIQLTPEAAVIGTLVTLDGEPVVDGLIRVGDREMVTDGRGAFEVGGLATGTWRIEASDERFGRASALIALVEGETRRVQMTLKASSPASGQVVDESGRPVAGATIVAVDAAKRRAYATSGAAGEFRFSTLEPGVYSLEAKTRRLSTAAPKNFLLPENGASDWRLEMEALGSISGVLTGSAEPPRRFRVSWSCAGDTATAGTIRDDQTFTVEGARPGTCWLIATLDQRQAATQLLSLAPGEAREGVELVLEDSPRLHGRLSAAGQDVGGAEVWISDPKGALLATARTDWAGHFELSAAVEGEFLMRARLAGGSSVFQRPLQLPFEGGELVWPLRAGRARDARASRR